MKQHEKSHLIFPSLLTLDVKSEMHREPLIHARYIGQFKNIRVDDGGSMTHISS